MAYLKDDAMREMMGGVARVVKKKDGILKKIGNLSKQTGQCTKDVKTIVDKLNRARKNVLMWRSFSKEISALRAEIIALREIESSEDSTVREVGEARRNVSSKIAQLQKICPHDFLMGYNGYEGSYSYDRDDAYSGQRKCVVCGLTDREKDSTRQENGVYGLLPAGDWHFYFYESEIYAQFFGRIESMHCDTLIEPTSDRVVACVSREEFYKIDIWRPFEELLLWFKNV